MGIKEGNLVIQMGYGQDTNDFILFSLLVAEKSTIEEAKARPKKRTQPTYPNLSEPIRTYPNLSEPIRTYPNLSERILTYPKHI